MRTLFDPETREVCLVDPPDVVMAALVALASLRPQEQEVVRLRAGGLTQRAVGTILGVSGARVGQIEIKAHRKLRHPVRGLRFYVRKPEGG